MYQNKKVLCFIGARSGSKGLKNKNIMDFGGQPLIHWTIRAALESEYLDKVIVSTDCVKIAEVARLSGAEAPFLRPQKLSEDDSMVEDAVRHCFQWIQQNERFDYDYVLRLQPTSPLRTARDIDAALQFYFENRFTDQDTLVSVTMAPPKSGWIMEQTKEGYFVFSLDESKGKRRRQEIKQYYYPNGAIYFAPISILRQGNYYTSRTLAFIMDLNRSIDIDTKEEFDTALSIFEKRRSLGV